MAFDAGKHLMKVRGGAQYLEVKWRLVWFREEHPEWGIQTAPVSIDLDKGYAIFHAEITNDEGRVIAAGTKQESARDFGDFVEKAETGSIGRALAVCGYGTQFAPDFHEGERIVDAPVGRASNGGGKVLTPPKAAPQAQQTRSLPSGETVDTTTGEILPPPAAAPPAVDMLAHRREQVLNAAKVLYGDDVAAFKAMRRQCLGDESPVKSLTRAQLDRLYAALEDLGRGEQPREVPMKQPDRDPFESESAATFESVTA